MDNTLAQRTAQASQELFDGICKALADHRGVHLETAVAAAGYLAGAAMLRSTGIDLSSLEPGSPVLVDQVNELGPMVLDTVFGLAHRGGVDQNSTVANAVPPGHQPLIPFLQLLPKVSPAMRQACDAHEIPPEMQPFVAARAAAQLLVAGRQQVDASILKALVAESVVQAAKTVPPR